MFGQYFCLVWEAVKLSGLRVRNHSNKVVSFYNLEHLISIAKDPIISKLPHIYIYIVSILNNIINLFRL